MRNTKDNNHVKGVVIKNGVQLNFIPLISTHTEIFLIFFFEVVNHIQMPKNQDFELGGSEGTFTGNFHR